MSKTKVEESMPRGQKIRTETGPEREKPIPGTNQREMLSGKHMGGGKNDLSHSITEGNKVKAW